MSETIYGRLITKAFTGAATIPPSADHSNGDWISTDIYEHELYIDDATGKLYTNINGVITQLNPTATDTNFANTNLTLNANRAHNLNGYTLKYTGTNTGVEIETTTGLGLSVIASTGSYAAYLEAQVAIDAFGTTTGGNFLGGINGIETNSYGSGYGLVANHNPSNAGAIKSQGKLLVDGSGLIFGDSAVFQVDSTTKGALLPRMTTAQRDAIGTPTNGLEIYNTTTSRKEVYNGSYWQGVSMQLLPVFHGSFNPADGQTVAFGQSVGVPFVSTNNYNEIIMRGNGVIRGCDLNMLVAGVTGTNENWSLYVRHNGTDYLVETVSSTSVVRKFSNTSMNIPYVDGDIVRMIYVNPTWATNPTVVLAGGNLILL